MFFSIQNADCSGLPQSAQEIATHSGQSIRAFRKFARIRTLRTRFPTFHLSAVINLLLFVGVVVIVGVVVVAVHPLARSKLSKLPLRTNLLKNSFLKFVSHPLSLRTPILINVSNKGSVGTKGREFSVTRWRDFLFHIWPFG